MKPTIQELEAQLAQAKLKLQEESRAARKALRPVYDWKVVPVDKLYSTLEHALGGVCIIGTLTNKPAFDAILRQFGSVDMPDERIRSVCYVWHAGFLHATGGGYCVLQFGSSAGPAHGRALPMTEEVWKRIKSGDVPSDLISASLK